jgi:hypothetical protein
MPNATAMAMRTAMIDTSDAQATWMRLRRRGSGAEAAHRERSAAALRHVPIVVERAARGQPPRRPRRACRAC